MDPINPLIPPTPIIIDISHTSSTKRNTTASLNVRDRVNQRGNATNGLIGLVLELRFTRHHGDAIDDGTDRDTERAASAVGLNLG